MKRFIFYFARNNLQFTLNELVSVASLLNVKMNVVDKGDETPFIVADLPSENDARSVASHSFLLKSTYEYISDCWNVKELEKATNNSPYAHPYIRTAESFMIRVKSTGFKQTHQDILSLVDHVAGRALHLEGPVDLSTPTHRFDLLLDRDPTIRNCPKEKEDAPTRTFLGRWITDGQRKMLAKYDLKTRVFIANTSMDPLLAFLMANEALVRENSLVLDPFCGSGGCMIACAHLGGYVIGADINYLLLHGRSRPSRFGVKKRAAGEGILANMVQYGLQHRFLDCFIGDASLMPSLWHWGVGIFDAIVTDPPYGVRESGRRLGSDEPYELTDDIRELHIPSKICYGFVEVYTDLLNLAATLLRVSGRLVFWIPSLPPTQFKDSHLPVHPCLRLVAHAPEGIRITTISRRLVTMEKTRDVEFESDHASIPENAFETKTFRDHVFRAQPSVNSSSNNDSSNRSVEEAGPSSFCDETLESVGNISGQASDKAGDKAACCRVHKRIMHKEASSG